MLDLKIIVQVSFVTYIAISTDSTEYETCPTRPAIRLAPVGQGHRLIDCMFTAFCSRILHSYGAGTIVGEEFRNSAFARSFEKGRNFAVVTRVLLFHPIVRHI